MHYSIWSLINQALTGNHNWTPAWREPEPKSHYDIVIVGGGGHGLATAFYLASRYDMKNIAVLEKWRTKGAGSLLMESFINQSKAIGAKKIFLEVRSKNFNAISFYQKYNFVKDAVRINYYSGEYPDDAILMSSDI